MVVAVSRFIEVQRGNHHAFLVVVELSVDTVIEVELQVRNLLNLPSFFLPNVFLSADHHYLDVPAASGIGETGDEFFIYLDPGDIT